MQHDHRNVCYYDPRQNAKELSDQRKAGHLEGPVGCYPGHNNNTNNNEDYLYSAKEPNERHSWRLKRIILSQHGLS